MAQVPSFYSQREDKDSTGVNYSVVPTGEECLSPVACSCGGVVIGVVRPWSTRAACWSHLILCVMGAPGLPRSECGGQHASRCGLTVREAEARSAPRPHRSGGVSADTNPEIAETLVHSAEALRERLIWCSGLEAVMTRARPSMLCCFRGGDRGAQCSAGADRGHSIRIQ